MKKEIYTCDGCGKQKGEANHWYCVILSSIKQPIIAIAPFGWGTEQFAKKYGEGPMEHFCGEECLMRMIGRNLPK